MVTPCGGSVLRVALIMSERFNLRFVLYLSSKTGGLLSSGFVSDRRRRCKQTNLCRA